MLLFKEQGAPVQFPKKQKNSLKFSGFDGPLSAWAETSTGKKYVYSTYGLGIALDTGMGEIWWDRTAAEIYLWRAVGETLDFLLKSRKNKVSGYNPPEKKITDPVILWRRRPAIEEDGPNKIIITMRLAIIPLAEVENIIPVKPKLSKKKRKALALFGD